MRHEINQVELIVHPAYHLLSHETVDPTYRVLNPATREFEGRPVERQLAPPVEYERIFELYKKRIHRAAKNPNAVVVIIQPESAFLSSGIVNSKEGMAANERAKKLLNELYKEAERAMPKRWIKQGTNYGELEGFLLANSEFGKVVRVNACGDYRERCVANNLKTLCGLLEEAGHKVVPNMLRIGVGIKQERQNRKPQPHTVKRFEYLSNLRARNAHLARR